ncbi:MAG: hypothetical protein CYG60_03580 [Actinobacteria bacterium]|nr:MAG: hypothetical protein CYG60_03580 [Actinomycetota bacterium]
MAVIKVQVEVESGAGRSLVSVRAANIGRALGLAGAGEPGVMARVVFSIESEPSFASGVPDEGCVAVFGSVGEPVGSAA